MENKIPIYRQIEQYIMNNIEDGIYAEGMMIPSEEDFCEKFHTSRMTVRKAFDILQTKGILHKKKGKGTFVSTFSIEKNMQTIHGWKETMQMAGYRTRSDLLKIAMEKADEKIAKKLHMKEGDFVYIIIRLRYANDTPILIEKAHLNAFMFPNLLQITFEEQSLYEILKRNYQLHIHHVCQKVLTQKLNGAYAQRLFQEDEATALVMENISYDDREIPLEYTISYINGELYSLNYYVT